MDPMAIDDILGLFVLVPIISGRAVSADQQIANLTLFYRVAAFIGNQCFIAWHELTRASRLYLAYTVADKDMQDLCAADAIEDVHIEFFFPAPQDIGGQGLTHPETNTDGGEIEAFLCNGQSEHNRTERGNTGRDGRAIPLQPFEPSLPHHQPNSLYPPLPHP